MKSSFTETEFKRVDDNNENIGIWKFCQAVQREKTLPLQCTSCFSFRAETDYPPRERRTGRGAPNVFVVGVILKRSVVYVNCFASDNISRIKNGFV